MMVTTLSLLVKMGIFTFTMSRHAS